MEAEANKIIGVAYSVCKLGWIGEKILLLILQFTLIYWSLLLFKNQVVKAQWLEQWLATEEVLFQNPYKDENLLTSE